MATRKTAAAAAPAPAPESTAAAEAGAAVLPAAPAATRAPRVRRAAVRSAPAPTAAAGVAKLVKAGKPRKTEKPKKAPKLRPLLVRDSFTLPEADFALIGTLKARALAGQRETKKSELLRAGLQALAAMDSAALLAALNALEPIKTGRPKKAD